MNGIIASGVVTPDGRPVVAQSPYAYSLGEATRFVGQQLACPPGVSTHDLRVEQDIRLQGAFYWAREPNMGDAATFSVVDVDDVLGQGAGYVVSEYVTNLPLAPWNHQQDILASTAGSIPAGLYLRVTYTNVGQADVSIGVTYRWFVG